MPGDQQTPFEYTGNHWRKAKTNTDHWRAWRPAETSGEEHTLLKITMNHQRSAKATEDQQRPLQTTEDRQGPPDTTRDHFRLTGITGPA